MMKLLTYIKFYTWEDFPSRIIKRHPTDKPLININSSLVNINGGGKLRNCGYYDLITGSIYPSNLVAIPPGLPYYLHPTKSFKPNKDQFRNNDYIYTGVMVAKGKDYTLYLDSMDYPTRTKTIDISMIGVYRNIFHDQITNTFTIIMSDNKVVYYNCKHSIIIERTDCSHTAHINGVYVDIDLKGSLEFDYAGDTLLIHSKNDGVYTIDGNHILQIISHSRYHSHQGNMLHVYNGSIYSTFDILRGKPVNAISAMAAKSSPNYVLIDNTVIYRKVDMVKIYTFTNPQPFKTTIVEVKGSLYFIAVGGIDVFIFEVQIFTP